MGDHLHSAPAPDHEDDNHVRDGDSGSAPVQENARRVAEAVTGAVVATPEKIRQSLNNAVGDPAEEAPDAVPHGRGGVQDPTDATETAKVRVETTSETGEETSTQRPSKPASESAQNADKDAAGSQAPLDAAKGTAEAAFRSTKQLAGDAKEAIGEEQMGGHSTTETAGKDEVQTTGSEVQRRLVGDESEWVEENRGSAVGLSSLVEPNGQFVKDQTEQGTKLVKGQARGFMKSLENPSGSVTLENPTQGLFPESTQTSFVRADELVSNLLETLTQDPNWTVQSTTATEIGRAPEKHISDTDQTSDYMKERATEIAHELGIPVPDFTEEGLGGKQSEERFQPFESPVSTVKDDGLQDAPVEVTGSVEERAAALVADLRLPTNSTSSSSPDGQSADPLDHSSVPTEDSQTVGRASKPGEESGGSLAACMTEAQDAVL